MIQIKDSSTDREIIEFTEGGNDEMFIAHSTEESIDILSRTHIHKAVVSLKNLKDTSILKFINDYYPAIQVVVLANKTFDDVISIFRKSNYSIIHEPLRLAELKGHLYNKQADFQNTNKY
ncbi:MAG: hypothetical protein K8R68_04785 [Bacteroidales bacterium]|nr:hypothetical protein [Bacteroidales bacterium]